MPCLLPCLADFRQELKEPPTVGSHFRQLLELHQHGGIVAPRGRVQGEHAGGIPHAQDLFPGQAPVHIARQGGQEGHMLHLLLPVQHGLEQMGDAPALGYIEAKELGQPGCRLPRGIVAPGAELSQLPALLVKGQITVHHGADAKGAKLGNLHAIALQDCGFQLHVG